MTSLEEKGISRFKNGKFLLVENRRKCHHLDNGRSKLRPGVFYGLKQFSSLTHALIRDGAVVCLFLEFCQKYFHMFLRSKMNRKRLLFIFFDRRTLLQFCWAPVGKFWFIHLSQRRKNANGANAVVLIKKHHKRTNRRDGRDWDSFHRFVNIGLCAFAD